MGVTQSPDVPGRRVSVPQVGLASVFHPGSDCKLLGPGPHLGQLPFSCSVRGVRGTWLGMPAGGETTGSGESPTPQPLKPRACLRGIRV